MYNLQSYCGGYDNNKNIKFLDGDINNTIGLIKNILNIDEIKISNWMNIE